MDLELFTVALEEVPIVPEDVAGYFDAVMERHGELTGFED